MGREKGREAIERAKGRFQSTVEMLEMLESILGSVTDAIEQAGDIEFAYRFRRVTRHVAYTVVGAEGEPSDEDRERFDELFEENWSWNQFEKHQGASDHREVVDDFGEFCRWIGSFEEQFGGTTGGSLEGLTAGIVETAEAVGGVFVRGDASGDRADDVVGAGREAIEELGLAGLE